MNTISPATSADLGPVSARRLNLISAVLVLGAITSLLDTTIVNIALDHLHTTFGTTVAQTQWVSTAYLLAYVAVIPVSGWAAERIGARRVWIAAISAFLVGSLLCGFAGTLPLLVAFRVLQGLGAGMILPVTITILTRAAGRERIGQAMIAIALPGQLAPILGPVIGGAIIESLDWHWLFFVNVPICIAALAFAPRVLPRDAGQRGRTFDLVGFLLLTPGVAAVAYGISQAGGPDAFGAPESWVPLAAGAALLVGFIAHALTVKRVAPLVDVRVFARRSFGLSSVITFVGGFSVYAIMFLLPLFYQQIRGESVAATGLLLIPQGLGTILFLVLSRRFLANIDGRFVVAGGVVLTMLGIVPFALAGTSGGEVLLLAAQFVLGIGLGAVSLPVMTLAFASLSPDETPRGSAAFSVVQRVGAPFGVAVIAVVLQSRMADAATPAAALAAFGGTFWWVLAFAAVPLVLAWFIPKKPVAEAAPADPARV
ncbi:MDR family MFS transporter [Agromyces protaetiae]|nr:MDR family MFS transporter [Agromyces protaetiae]